VPVAVDFLPEASFTLDYFRALHARAKEKTIGAVFGGVLSEDFIGAFLAYHNLKAGLAAGDVEGVYARLKNVVLTVMKTRLPKEAQVSLGGVAADEIDPEHFESRLHENLFIMGEAIDYTGGCGGYNIHWCAATARGVADRLRGKVAGKE
jgi:predicted flavoprotein YhiN